MIWTIMNAPTLLNGQHYSYLQKLEKSHQKNPYLRQVPPNESFKPTIEIDVNHDHTNTSFSHLSRRRDIKTGANLTYIS